MQEVIHFRVYEEEEQQLIDEIMGQLEQIDDDEYRVCRELEADISRLSNVFSHFPSILDQRRVGNRRYTLESLIEILYKDGCDHTVLLPTKVVVGRSFNIAKFNFFGYLIQLCTDFPDLNSFLDDLQQYWEFIIFSLLTEDIYQVIIEREGRYNPGIRRQAAVDLIYLWEFRFDRNVTEYASNIVDLWMMRNRAAPVFGTMLGTIELMKISSSLSDRWHRFLMAWGDDEEVIQALEEFLFGLSYEDILLVRRRMEKQKLAVIDREKLNGLLGKKTLLADGKVLDPREAYRFYQERAKWVARRNYTGEPGPQRTLEEILLVYLIDEKQSRPQQ